ncbi:unnamed protein product, partial [Brachionus calyciflorus]
MNSENSNKKRIISTSSSGDINESRNLFSLIKTGLNEIVEAGTKRLSTHLQNSKFQKSSTNDHISKTNATSESVSNKPITSSLSDNNIKKYQLSYQRCDSNLNESLYENDWDHFENDMHENQTTKWEK